jgi:hypothetical protein
VASVARFPLWRARCYNVRMRHAPRSSSAFGWMLAMGLAWTPAVAAAEEVHEIVVAVGQTVERDVAWAMGHHCDDPELVRAEMRNKDRESNLFVVTGRKVGKTLCRAGTYHVEGRPTYLFEVTVVPARATK